MYGKSTGKVVGKYWRAQQVMEKYWKYSGRHIGNDTGTRDIVARQTGKDTGDNYILATHTDKAGEIYWQSWFATHILHHKETLTRGFIKDGST